MRPTKGQCHHAATASTALSAAVRTPRVELPITAASHAWARRQGSRHWASSESGRSARRPFLAGAPAHGFAAVVAVALAAMATAAAGPIGFVALVAPQITRRLLADQVEITDEALLAIITEYNRSTQGFLVSAVERIVNMNWSSIHPPPSGTGRNSYLTAVTEVEGRLVEIIDVEKVLAEIAPLPDAVSEALIEESKQHTSTKKHVLIVDDSAIARKQIQKVMEEINVTATVLKNGREALTFLEDMLTAGKNPYEELLLVISDIEMPEMDGYTFTAEIRINPKLRDLFVILHTSLSGVFNEAMVKKVGANDFIAKFHPNELAKRVNKRMSDVSLVNS